MVYRANESKVDIRTEMRGGTGDVVINHLFEDKPTKCRMFSTITLKKGCSIGEHIHENETEVFYVLQGNAEYLDNGNWVSLKAGDTAVNGCGQSHSVKNDGDTDVVLLAVIITE